MVRPLSCYIHVPLPWQIKPAIVSFVTPLKLPLGLAAIAIAAKVASG